MTSTPDDRVIRAISAEEFAAFSTVIEHAFAETFDEEVRAHEASLLEFDRTLAAFDGTELVGTTAAYSFAMTVPGGGVPTAGVTWVSVLPTHRRRGIFGSLMRRQLDDIHAGAQEPVAALWATESAIYGRYGYGLASSSLNVAVPRSANHLRPVAGGADLRVRYVDTLSEETLDLVHQVYEHERARRVGMIALTPAWQHGIAFDPPSERKGATPLRTVLADGEGGTRAFARYSVKLEWADGQQGSSQWGDGTATGAVSVHHMFAADPAAAWAMWRHLTDLDLTVVTRARRPLDDPLLSLLSDPRRATKSLRDDLYVRLVDVGAALAARTYAIPIDVVIEVTDAFCPWNAGRWHLVGDATAARCERTSAAPAVAVDVRELGAAYLGSTTLRGLADAGLVAELSPGAVTELSQALGHPGAAWAPFVF